MTMLLRCIYGENKGLYYCGYDETLRRASFNNLDTAKKLLAEDARGITAALIDTAKIVVIPERLPDTTDEEIDEYSTIVAGDFWQNDGISLIPIIKVAIRKSPDEPIMDGETEMLVNEDKYAPMSVWEWLTRVMQAKKPND